MSTVVITGASGGIGAACCRLFSEYGWNVIICYNSNKTSADDLCYELNALRAKSAHAIHADVSDEAQVKSLFFEAYNIFPELTAVINCAGTALSRTVDQTSCYDWDKIFNINAKGTFLCCREAVPYMLKKRKGSIVNVSSVWGVTGASCETAYSASKGAVIAFTKALAKELGPSGIRVNCIAPGVIDTPMLKCYTKDEIDTLAQAAPLGVIGNGADVAQSAYFLCSDASVFITGQVISPNGGYLI